MACHEWKERFNVMKIKRPGPSVVPAEANIPLDKLDKVLTELGERISQPLAIEGMGVSGREMVLLGFIPHDERSTGYPFAFSLALTVSAVAKKHGGRPYSTGLYFANEVKTVLGKEKLDQQAVNTYTVCTTCERCNVNCPEGLPVEPAWLTPRNEFIEKKKFMIIPPFEIMSAFLNNNLNIWAYYRENCSDWIPEEVKSSVKDGAELLYFAGCTASFVEQDIACSATRLLHDAEIEFSCMGNDECCYGLPMLVAGKWDQFAEILKQNVSTAERMGAKTVVTSCPACWLSWTHALQGVGAETWDFLQFFSKTLLRGSW